MGDYHSRKTTVNDQMYAEQRMTKGWRKLVCDPKKDCSKGGKRRDSKEAKRNSYGRPFFGAPNRKINTEWGTQSSSGAN